MTGPSAADNGSDASHGGPALVPGRCRRRLGAGRGGAGPETAAAGICGTCSSRPAAGGRPRRRRPAVLAGLLAPPPLPQELNESARLCLHQCEPPLRSVAEGRASLSWSTATSACRPMTCRRTLYVDAARAGLDGRHLVRAIMIDDLRGERYGAERLAGPAQGSPSSQPTLPTPNRRTRSAYQYSGPTAPGAGTKCAAPPLGAPARHHD